MPLEYNITYTTTNNYENLVKNAHWQLLIIPETNESQEFVEIHFDNSLKAINEYSSNGYGFKTIRVNPKKEFKQISFEANIKLTKKEVNPFDFNLSSNNNED